MEMKRPIKREGQGDNSASLAAVCCPAFSAFLRPGRGGCGVKRRGGGPVCLSTPTKRSSSEWKGEGGGGGGLVGGNGGLAVAE